MRGSERGKGERGYVILVFRVPTTSVWVKGSKGE